MINKGHLLSSKPPLHESLICLESFICSQQGPASIKVFKGKSQIGEYAICNNILSQRDGITIESYIGLTAYDIGRIMKRERAVTENAVNIDTKILTGQLPYAQYKQSIIVNGGFVSIEAVSKRPVYNKNNKVIGLLAYANDTTPYTSPLYLFRLYQQHYPNKEAIRYFLQYMELSDFFHTLPTKRELEVLLTMRESSVAKEIARILGISPKTVDENKARLRDHLRNITLSHLVMKLRIHREINEDVIS